MNKIYIGILSLILMVIIILATFLYNTTIPVSTFGEIQSSAKSAVVIEYESRRVLTEKNKDKKLPMASTTKIMTALITIENCKDLDEVVKINKNAIGIEGTSIYLRPTDNLTVKELLYGLMLASGNDASLALAYHTFDDNIQLFIHKMNERAKEIGAFNTHFVNPHGLDQKEHYTTAYDLAIITAEAMKNDVFREIVSTKNIQISGNEEVGNRYLYNKQRLLKTYDGCIGVKTGFTDNAGRCSVSAVKRDDMTLICVVLNCPDMFEESARLLNLAFSEYNLKELIKPYSLLNSITVIDGNIDRVRTFVKNGFSYPLKKDEESKLEIVTDLPEELTAPIEKENIVGEIKFYLDKDLIFSEKIYTMDNVESVLLKDKVKNIIDNWFYS